MRALITGGAGFIGSHLAEVLLGRGFEVDVLDDLSTGSLQNLEHLRPDDRLHVTVDKVEAAPGLAALVERASATTASAPAAKSNTSRSHRMASRSRP